MILKMMKAKPVLYKKKDTSFRIVEAGTEGFWRNRALCGGTRNSSVS